MTSTLLFAQYTNIALKGVLSLHCLVTLLAIIKFFIEKKIEFLGVGIIYTVLSAILGWVLIDTTDERLKFSSKVLKLAIK